MPENRIRLPVTFWASRANWPWRTMFLRHLRLRLALVIQSSVFAIACGGDDTTSTQKPSKSEEPRVVPEAVPDPKTASTRPELISRRVEPAISRASLMLTLKDVPEALKHEDLTS